jgi:hypothetical protein
MAEDCRGFVGREEDFEHGRDLSSGYIGRTRERQAGRRVWRVPIKSGSRASVDWARASSECLNRVLHCTKKVWQHYFPGSFVAVRCAVLQSMSGKDEFSAARPLGWDEMGWDGTFLGANPDKEITFQLGLSPWKSHNDIGSTSQYKAFRLPGNHFGRQAVDASIFPSPKEP